MIRSFHINNYRCFSDLTLPRCARVNIIAGKNNVGKTALIESFLLYAGATNPALALQLNGLRGIATTFGGKEHPFSSLAKDFNIEKPISLEGKNDYGTRKLRIELKKKELQIKLVKDSEDVKESISSHVQFNYTDESNNEHVSTLILDRDKDMFRSEPSRPTPYNAMFFSANSRPGDKDDLNRFSDVKMKGHIELVVETLKIIEPSISKLEILTVPNPTIHADIGKGRLYPIALLGDGTTRILRLVVGIASSENGLVLVDEIENGIHHSVMVQVWKALFHAAKKFNVQIFATTHSRECVMAVHEAIGEEADALLLHRLDRINDNIVVKTYDAETLGAALEANIEFR